MDLAVFVSIIASELKDFLLLDITPSLFALGLVVHHVVTCLGCLWCLTVPVGRGVVTLNAIVAELGSCSFNIHSLWPTVGTCAFYCVFMTASNILAYVLSLRFVAVAKDAGADVTFYSTALVLLVVLRQAPIVKIGAEQLSNGSFKKAMAWRVFRLVLERKPKSA